MQKLLYSISILWLLLLLASCGVPKNFQNAVYLRDSVTEAEKMVVNKPAIIMQGDRLHINIAAINQEAAQAFNIVSAEEGATTHDYLVDSLGNIQVLELGVIHVEGLTTPQLQQSLQQQLVNYIKGPVVTVNISNFKISVMGEVTTPGTLTVPDGKINILQALTQSGDLTLYAKRENILVIREANGKREFGRVNIASNQIFTSPYYNLQQNDLIYVEPDKTKFIANDAVTNRNIRNLGILLTLLSTALLLQNLFK